MTHNFSRDAHSHATTTANNDNDNRGNQPELALEVLDRMKADGLNMDRMTYGVLIFLYSRRGEWDACLRVGDDMEKARRNRRRTGRD